MVAAATGTNFPDALAAGPSLGLAKGPLLLVAPIVLAVTFLSSYIPARRASRANPMDALRCE